MIQDLAQATKEEPSLQWDTNGFVVNTTTKSGTKKGRVNRKENLNYRTMTGKEVLYLLLGLSPNKKPTVMVGLLCYTVAT